MTIKRGLLIIVLFMSGLPAVFSQVEEHPPPSVTVNVKTNDPGQLAPHSTNTSCEVVEPEIVASPLIDHE